MYDAVYERNMSVAENLNVVFKYTESDYAWSDVQNNIRTIVLANDDVFDLIVNDQIGLAALSIEKMFINVYDCKYFDFDQSYWWYEYMQDLTIGKNKMYLLVGDYFIDVLRKSHVIYYNRNIFENTYVNPDDIYINVNDGKWTFDKMIEYMEGTYNDINGDGIKDDDDIYGLLVAGIGGSIFPYQYAGNPDFIKRDSDGIPSIVMQNDRTDRLYNKIFNVYYNDATHTDYDEHSDKLFNKFKGDGSLLMSTVSIGDFDRLRDMESGVGILPYPKLDESQDTYYTTIHDTAEIGAIPITCADIDFASAVVQALCKESMSSVIPAYYETALKIKYARDDYSSQMIDIIYDGIKGLFPLVYGATYANNIFTWALLEPLKNKNQSWISGYESRIEAANIQLQNLIDAYLID